MSTLFLKGKSGNPDREVHSMPWTADTARPWSNGYSRVYMSKTQDGKLDRHKSGEIGHVMIVKDSNLRVEK